MYTVIMGAGSDRERALTKARAITTLPSTSGELAVVVVHASDDPDETNEISEGVLEFFEGRDIDVEVETVHGDPPAALLDMAAEHEADLICVGGRQHSPAGKVQLRRGAQSVILNADRPVLVAGEPDENDH